MSTPKQAQQPKQPGFKVGEYITIKNVLFKIQGIRPKKLILKSCSQKEVDRVNLKIKELQQKEAQSVPAKKDI